MKKLVLHESMGPAVIHHLRGMADMGTKGFVAGQSVASAVSELYGDGKAVKYNDVDVFRSRTSEEQIAAEERLKLGNFVKKIIGTVEMTAAELTTEYDQLSFSAVQQYRVLSTSREGMLNEVQCMFHSSQPVGFLKTFDINCVQVLVDLETEKLHWTKAFGNFCVTRQVEIETLHTPVHSLVRYFRKREELEGVFGNDERMIELVAAAWVCDGSVSDFTQDSLEKVHHTQKRWYFGKSYREKLASVASKISPHFETLTKTVNGYDVTTLKPRFEPGKDLADPSREMTAHSLPYASKALREKFTPGKQGRMHYLATTQKSSFLKDCWLSQGLDFVQGNVTPAQMAELDRVCREHKVSKHFGADTLTEVWTAYFRVKKEVMRRGQWVYGVLETCILEAWTDESLSKFLDEQFKLLSETLVTKGIPDIALDGYVFHDLTTGLEMMQEGIDQHHCVGGYANAVKAGRSRIIQIRPADEEGKNNPELRLTMQLAKKGFAAWEVVQLRGVLNRVATDEEFTRCKRYARHFNFTALIGARASEVLTTLYPKGVDKVLGVIAMAQALRNSRSPKVAGRISNWLCNKFGIKQTGFDLNRRWVSPAFTPYRFWLDQARRLIAVRPAAAMLAVGVLPQVIQGFDDMDDDIPF